jgi:VWFA-related protein
MRLQSFTGGRRMGCPLGRAGHAAIRLCVLFLLVASSVPSDQAEAGPVPEPVSKIALAPLGYQGLATVARLTEQANVTVNFVDDDHVLFTFDPKKLVKRLPECPPWHQDRIVQAEIFQVSTGKVTKQASWYLHDQQRYLWSLGSGKFLLRKLNSLYELDPDLNEKLVLSSDREFLWISVTPDGRQIIVERADDKEPPSKKPQDKSKPETQKVKIEFLDANTMAVVRTIKAEGIVDLTAESSGFGDVIHNWTGKIWLVRFGPTGRERNNIARVRSRCSPNLLYSSANTMLIGRCAMNSSDYSVSAFTVTGHVLWRQHWSQHRYTPKLDDSEDGSRFAVSTLKRIQPAGTANSDGDESDDNPDKSLQQNVQVFNTATGDPLLSLTLTPPVLTAQNFSLSPDGLRLAALEGTTLEFYDLRPMNEEERKKYTAMKADAPGLYVAPSAVDAEAALQKGSDKALPEEEFSAVDASETDPGPDAKTAAPDAAKDTAAQPPIAETKNASPQSVVASSQTQSEASGSKPKEQPAVTFRTGTQVVVVDVVVTDSKGHPVKGLPQQDFRLDEDNKPQGIRYFKEFTEAGPLTANSAPGAPQVPTAPDPAKLPPNIFTNNTPVPETGSVMLILYDLLNTPLPDQARAQAALLKFLARKPKDMQCAIFALTSNLRMLEGFTADEDKLISVASGKKGSTRYTPWDPSNDAGLQQSVQNAQDLAARDTTMEALVQRLQAAQDQGRAYDADMRMRTTLAGFAQLASYLAGVPGRKNLVWLSGAFPMNLFPNTSFGGSDPAADPWGNIRNYEEEVKKAANLLAESHVAVYPVDVRGAVTQTVLSASNNTDFSTMQQPGSMSGAPNSNGMLANTALNAAAPSLMQQQAQEASLSNNSEHSSMDAIASDTGGKAFYNTNGIEDAIQSAVDQGSHYYTISYTPANKRYDGKFRKIKVSLAAKGYHLSYRRGYYAIDPFAPIKDTSDAARTLALASMQHGSPQSRQIMFAVRVTPLGKPRKVEEKIEQTSSKKKRKPATETGPVEMQHYGVDYAVDPKDLRFTPTNDGQHGELNFMVTAFDDDGRLLTRLVSSASSDFKPATFKDVMLGGFRLHQEFDVPVKAVALRLGVEDLLSSHIGTLELSLPVKAPPDMPQVTARALPDIEPD